MSVSDLAKQIAAHTERTKGVAPKSAKQILGGTYKEKNGNMAVYLPRDMIAALKKLAFEEGRSVSEIAKELFEQRLKDGPRQEEPDRRRRVIE
ncbi:ParB-like dsDNA partitioning protein [Mycobacterium phage LadyBird]|uniref:Arc-like repressor n=1 Tax=Mycobacterium phage LadyBird TaxID=1718166 RepID=UPI0006CE3D49|nr:Arc-like repressor [Mycobacterium phage LadyBird]ALF02177.1 ParB-like dsDNA partitioning protein [Mycobacterium phage LadyBird]